MKTHHQRLPMSVYIVLSASIIANAVVTFIMFSYFL